MKNKYIVYLSDDDVAILKKAADYNRLRVEDFMVAAARYSVTKMEQNKQTILKLRAEEEELCGIKRS